MYREICDRTNKKYRGGKRMAETKIDIKVVDIVKKYIDEISKKFDIQEVYLFGSYAKGKATEESDVDLLIATSVSGIQFYDLVETIRENLKKKVDILNYEQLNENPDLVHEILKDGIKIYG